MYSSILIFKSESKRTAGGFTPAATNGLGIVTRNLMTGLVDLITIPIYFVSIPALKVVLAAIF